MTIAGTSAPDRPAIGVDLGGTKIEALALSPAGEPVWRERIPTPAGDYDGTLSAIAGLVSRAEAALGVRAGEATVGVGMPGTTGTGGRVKNANSTWLNGRPFEADLSRRLDRPVATANDANCMALSEAVDGAGAGAGGVFGVILGTGVGGGLVIDGRVRIGPNGLAGEWGHTPLPWATPEEAAAAPPCYCGRRGCIETWLSGPGLARDHAHHRGVDPTAPESPTAAGIARLATAGDREAIATLDRHAERLARALAVIIDIVDPDVIVLAGGVSNLDRLVETVPLHWPGWVFGAGPAEPVCTRLVRARHGDASGVRGAAWLGRQGRLTAPLI